MLIQAQFKLPGYEKKKATAYEFQNRALEIASILGVPKGFVFRHIKKDRTKVEAAYRYIVERKPDNPASYFQWLMTH